MTNETRKHTALPWRHAGIRASLIVGNCGRPVADCSRGSEHPAESDRDYANAEHIIRCVNSYDHLVATAEALLDYMPKGRITGSCDPYMLGVAIIELRAAIAEAKGGA